MLRVNSEVELDQSEQRCDQQQQQISGLQEQLTTAKANEALMSFLVAPDLARAHTWNLHEPPPAFQNG